MSSIQSVNSYNTCNTGDGTVQASNKKTHLQYRKRRPSYSGGGGAFKPSSPRIAEGDETLYNLSGSSDGSPYVRKLSTSSGSGSDAPTTSTTSNIKAVKKVDTTKATAIGNGSGKGMGQSREIKYDLSGMSDELRDDLQKVFGGAVPNATKCANDNEQAWYSFLFCVNNDTTNDAHTIGTLDSESTLDVEGNNHNNSANDFGYGGRQSPPSGSGVGTAQLRPVSRGSQMNRFSSIATDAALLSSTRRDPVVASSISKSKKTSAHQSHSKGSSPRRPPCFNTTTASASATSPPPSPTKLKEGAGSLDIVMELQLEEDLRKSVKESKKKEKKEKKEKKAEKKEKKGSPSGGFRKKIKGQKKSTPKPQTPSSTAAVVATTTPSPKRVRSDNLLVQDNEASPSSGDMGSVISDRSIFSFATEVQEKNKKGANGNSKSPSSSPSRMSVMQKMNKSLCITGPANGTFLNISPTSGSDPEHSELCGTYSQFRVHDKGVEMVLNRIGTTVPLYHWKCAHAQSFRFGNISMSVSSEELGLSSFSHLDLTSPSMKSTASESEVPVDLKNVCSEPSSKGFHVRGPTYLKDAKKVPSGETMFSLLGADSIIKSKDDDNYVSYDVCKAPDSYLKKITAKSKRLGLKPPFLIVINFVVPWGNFLSYYYRPDADNGGPYCNIRKNHASEKLWKSFLEGGITFRNDTLKFIPKILEGPWALKKLVGTQPAVIGQKIPTMYYGSVKDGYIEICMDVTRGGKMANSICSAVASKASLLSIDLAFLLQGTKKEELPEQLLTAVRLHHVSLKKKKADRIEI